jgi:hypothetical protein
VRAHFDYYLGDPDMQRVDAFICTFPMAMCEAWLPFNKTVIFVAGHRYALGRCNAQRWARLDQHIAAAAANGHIVASSTVYDQAYLNYYTGLDVPLLPINSLFYVNRRELPAHAVLRDEILVGPLQLETAPFSAELAAASGESFHFATAKQLYGRFELGQLATHRAAILFPYTAHSSYGIAELYALGVPLFVPAPQFLLSLNIVGDRLIAHMNYCGEGSFLPQRHAASRHVRSPESSEHDDALYWLSKAEYYTTMPHVTTFSSFADLAAKLVAANFTALRASVAAHLDQWEGDVKASFAAIAARVPKGRVMPASYEEALLHVVRDTTVQR